jgi:uncharacterized tellurite resistance protein B-like protein
MDTNFTILDGYNPKEKGAYLGAIASIATADAKASEEEIEYLSVLSDAAQLSAAQKEAVIQSASEITGAELTQCLDVLKSSQLKYSLVADLMAFAKADNNYSEEEQQSIHKIADYLGVDQQQFSLLKEFTQKATDPSTQPEEVAKPSFIANTGLQDKMQQAGINTGGLLTGLIGVVGPIVVAQLLNGGRRPGGGMLGGLGGGILGGMLGGGMFNRGMRSGGLGSIISMLNGGRGMSSAGGLLSRILRGR